MTDSTVKQATQLTHAVNTAVSVPPPETDPEASNAKDKIIEELGDDYTVPGVSGTTAWSLAGYAFLPESWSEPVPPDTVNPSLWRNAVLNMNCGLYEVVHDAVYQVRGMDLANISFLEDPTGTSRSIVVVDPLGSAETAAAALDLYQKHRGLDRKIVAVIYTHSHVDHYGGVRGLFRPDGVLPPGVTIAAPDGFLDHAVSENVYAGNAMSRRASFMYGFVLDQSPTGQVDAGLGKGTSAGLTGLIPPTDVITPDNKTRTYGPIEFTFQLTPDTEAPAEMNFYLPQSNALCMAENANPTLHNLYSLRGAQVRDAKNWSYYLNEAVDLFGDTAEVLFASHFWPRWKTDTGEEIIDFLTKQADMYRFLHDQTLRLANHGRTMHEIAEDLDQALPTSLADKWYNHGYYGTTNHDIKAVYQRYLGWYDGNAAHLHGLPPAEVGMRYVAAMGGAAQVIALAQDAYDNAKSVDDYRWAAELLSHVAFAEPDNAEARCLEADVLEQLGYQAESAPWRNFYLAGAQELRGKEERPDGSVSFITPDVIAAMPLEMVFDYLGIRLNGPQAGLTALTIGLSITSPPSDPSFCKMMLRNGVLVYKELAEALDESSADATYTLSRTGLNELALAQKTPDELAASGDLSVNNNGPMEPINEFHSLLETFLWAFALTLPSTFVPLPAASE